MKNLRKKSVFLFFIFFSLFVQVFFSGCSDSSPEIARCSATVVFSYNDESSLPDVKFQAYISALSDVRRLESFSVENRGNKFKWIVENPYIFSDSNNSWACALNLCNNKNQKIPLGIYDVVYNDAQGQSVSSVLNVFYPEELYKKTFPEAENFIKDNTLKQIAVYTESGMLLYYGVFKEAWKSDEIIFKNFKDSQKYRICYSAFDESYLVMSKYFYKNSESQNSSEIKS